MAPCHQPWSIAEESREPHSFGTPGWAHADLAFGSKRETPSWRRLLELMTGLTYALPIQYVKVKVRWHTRTQTPNLQLKCQLLMTPFGKKVPPVLPQHWQVCPNSRDISQAKQWQQQNADSTVFLRSCMWSSTFLASTPFSKSQATFAHLSWIFFETWLWNLHVEVPSW